MFQTAEGFRKLAFEERQDMGGAHNENAKCSDDPMRRFV